MLKPWDLAQYSNDDADNYAGAEDLIWSYIVNLIGDEAAKHDDKDDKWVNELLNHADDVRQYAAMITVSPTKQASKQLHNELSTISQNNVKDAESWLQKATGKQFNPIKGSKSFKKIVNDNLDDADHYLNLARRNMSTNAYKSFKGIIGQARTAIDTGTVPSKAISQATTQWAEQGIPALIDKAGRNWSPDVYVRTVVNSSINRAANDTELMRYRQYGALVKVSLHAGCRPSHLQYQNQIYSLEGDTGKYQDFESTTGYGSITGIGGINCRHYTLPYVDGFGNMQVSQQSDDENAAQYQLEQNQRRLEREVRKGKRQLLAAQKLNDDIETSHYKRLVNARQSRLRQFVDRNNLLIRQYSREKVFTNKEMVNKDKRIIKDKLHAQELKYTDLKYKLGNTALPDTFDEYRLIVNDPEAGQTMRGYIKWRLKREIDPTVTFEHFASLKSRLEDELLGFQTSDGVAVTGISTHAVARSIGSRFDKDKKSHKTVYRSAVSTNNIKDALRNGNVIKSEQNERRKLYNGVGARVILDYVDGKIVTIIPGGGRKR